MSCSWMAFERVAPEPEDRLLQLETRALVVSADHEQRRHGPPLPRFCSPGSRLQGGNRAGVANSAALPRTATARQQFFDFTNQGAIVVGLGDEFPVGGRFSTTDVAEQDQWGVLRSRVLSQRGRQRVCVGSSLLDFQYDQVRMMPPGELQPLGSARGGKSPQPATLQRCLKDLSRLLGRIDDQHASLAVQSNTLRGVVEPNILVGSIRSAGPAGGKTRREGERITIAGFRVKADSCKTGAD